MGFGDRLLSIISDMDGGSYALVQCNGVNCWARQSCGILLTSGCLIFILNPVQMLIYSFIYFNFLGSIKRTTNKAQSREASKTQQSVSRVSILHVSITDGGFPEEHVRNTLIIEMFLN